MPAPGKPLFFEQRARQLELSAPKCYAQLVAAILSAKTTYISPSKAWSSLFQITSRFDVGAQNALTMVVHFFIVAEPSERSFFISVLRQYKDDVKKQQRKSGDGVESCSKKCPTCVDAMPCLSREIGLLLQDVSEQILSVEETHATVRRLCKASAILIREHIISLDALWPYMETDEKLSQCYSAYKDAIDTQIQEEWLDTIPFADDKPLNSDATGSEDERKSYEAKQELTCSINVLLMEALLAENCLMLVEPYLAAHDKLPFSCPGLRNSVIKCLQAKSESSDTTYKFIFLHRAAEMLGPHFGQDAKFFAQACELCAAEYRKDKILVLDVIREAILPALSLYKYSKSAASAAWSVLANIDQNERFNLYGKWRGDVYDRAPALKVPKVITRRKVKALMQRLTEETIESVGRSIALLAATNPLLVWKEVLQHVLEDGTLIPLVLKFTVSYGEPLALDTLFFTILDMLETKERPFFKQDGVSFQEWFISLSYFTGSLFARSAYLQGSSLVTYLDILAEHISSRATHLFLLSDLLTCISGIKPFRNLSESQIKALGGSNRLRMEVLRPTTTETIEDLAVIKKEMSEADADENLFLDQTGSTSVDQLLRDTFLLSLDRLMSALSFKSLIPRLLTKLGADTVITDISYNRLAPWSNRRDRKTIVFKQFLEILKLGEQNLYELCKNSDPRIFTTIAPLVDMIRPGLRAQINFRSAHLFDDIVSIFPIRRAADHKLFSFFWTFEAYDVYVPEQEYTREMLRIESLENDDLSSTMFDASRKRIVDSLKASQAEHVAHVDWISSQLPKLRSPDTVTLLDEMILPRAKWSQTDAHYVFCFLSRTLVDPLPVLGALFDIDKLFTQFHFGSGEMMIAFAYFVDEIWQDASSTLFKGRRVAFVEDHGKNGDATNSRVCTRHSDQAQTTSCMSQENYVTSGCTNCRYTLFRDSTEVDVHLRHWEDNLFEALSKALSSRIISVVDNALNFATCLAKSFPRRCKVGRALMDDYLAPLIEDKMRTRVANLAKTLNEIYVKRQVHWDGYAEWKAEHQMQTKDSEKIEGCAAKQLAHGTAGNKDISEEKPFTRGDPAKVRPLKRSNVAQRNGTKRQCTKVL